MEWKIRGKEQRNLFCFDKFTQFIMHPFCRISLVPATLPVRWTSSVFSSRLWPQRWAPIFVSQRWAPVIIVLVLALLLVTRRCFHDITRSTRYSTLKFCWYFGGFWVRSTVYSLPKYQQDLFKKLSLKKFSYTDKK